MCSRNYAGSRRQPLRRASSAAAIGAPGDRDERALVAALGHDPVTLDTLLQRSGLTPETLSAMLLTMELDGRVSRLPGGRFQSLQE